MTLSCCHSNNLLLRLCPSPRAACVNLLPSAFNSLFYVLLVSLFLELSPSSGSSSDAFHINIQCLVTVMFCQLCPFPTPGMPYFARLTVNKNTYISNSWHHVLPPSFTTQLLTFCAYARRRPAAFQSFGEAPCTIVYFEVIYHPHAMHYSNLPPRPTLNSSCYVLRRVQNSFLHHLRFLIKD